MLSIGANDKLPVLFMRELDDAWWTVVHQSPYDWTRQAVCTADDVCYGCERAAAEPYSGWVQKPKLVIDVLDTTLNPNIMIQTLTPSSLTNYLLMYYNEHGTICNTWFEVSKVGTGKKTKHQIRPIVNKAMPVQKSLLDLHKTIKTLDYTAQEKYLTQI